MITFEQFLDKQSFATKKGKQKIIGIVEEWLQQKREELPTEKFPTAFEIIRFIDELLEGLREKQREKYVTEEKQINNINRFLLKRRN